MGKASKRRATRHTGSSGGSEVSRPAPFVHRPFEGMPGETEWVALRELLPAATAPVQLLVDALPDADADGGARTATVTTVLPLAWPALHRGGGDVFVATQSGATSGDASRDLAAALLLALSAEEGTAVTSVPTPTADSPRLQDLLDISDEAPAFRATVHEGFDYWVSDAADLDADGRASLEQANASVIPTTRVTSDAPSAASVYWCQINDRTYVRWVLPYAEDAATDAIARLHAAGDSLLTPDTRLLGAFRAAGLLVPVWEVPADAAPESFDGPVTELAARLEAAVSDAPLTVDERRAKAGLLSRQVTLR